MSERLGGPGGVPEIHEVRQEILSAADGPIRLLLGDQPFSIRHVEKHLPRNPFADDPTVDYVIVVNESEKSGEKGDLVFLPILDNTKLLVGRNRQQGEINYRPSVSREHALIERHGDRFRVSDLDSTNGTYRLVYPEAWPVVRGAAKTERVEPLLRLAAMTVASASHAARNEDAYLISRQMPSIGVFDGVGSKTGSELAAQAGAGASKEYLDGLPIRAARGLALSSMHEALWVAHERIIEQPKPDPQDPGSHLAATATIARVFQTEQGAPYIGMASVGDTRPHLFRAGALTHLTLDQAYMPTANQAEAMDIQETLAGAVSLSKMTAKERLAFDNRHMITSWLGDEATPPVVTVSAFALHQGDVVLITSDGIHDNLTTKEIEAILSDYDEPEVAVGALIRAASERSEDTGHIRAKRDDMTAAILRYR